MKFKKSLFAFLIASSLCAFGLCGCSGEDSKVVEVKGELGDFTFDLDSLMIPDSLFGTDSLYSWFLEQMIKNVEQPSGDKDKDEGDEDEDENVDLSPKLLPPAGFYAESFTIPEPAPVKGGQIYCTLDGGDPMDYEEVLDWPLTITKNTVVRCVEAKGGYELRKSTQTYFVGETVSMPVVAISVDPSFFRRVYVNTSRCEGADPYLCPGLMDETEDPVHVEFFENGSRSSGKAWEVDAGISLMGNYSRTYPKKPVAIKIKKQYNEKKLKYNLFAVRPEVNKFRGFNLRNSGNRYVGDLVGDPAMTAIVEGSSVDYQRNRQVVVFYNGEYYGIHDLRERLNEHFVETNYGIDNNTVEMVKQKKDVVTPSAGDGHYYAELLAFVASNDFSGENNEAYAKVQTMMDVGNYADYLAAQFYLKNADWPSNNMRAWRSPGQPFKFMLFDTDQSLEWQWVSSDFKMNGGNMFKWMRNDRGEGRTGPGYFANIYVKLMENPDFRRMFANHGAVMLNEYLTEERLKKSLSAVNAQIPDSEIERDMKKFRRNYCGFYPNMCMDFDARGDMILYYSKGRNAALRADYRKEFGFGDDITVSVGANGGGYVTIDGMKLPRVNYTGTFFGGNSMLLKAEATTGIFKQWSDGVKDNPRLVTPEDGSVFTAEFL